MGRLLLLLLIIAAIVLIWMAFRPATWKRNQQAGVGRGAPKAPIKGPDDDEEFLWNIEKNRFKERRAREAAAREEEERVRRARKRYDEPADEPTSQPTEHSDESGSTEPDSTGDEGTSGEHGKQ